MEEINYKKLRDKMYRLAKRAHKGQTYREEGDYFEVHVKAVAKYATTIREAIVALGHDLVEDTWVTEEYLRERGFPEPIIRSIMLLTRDKEKYTYSEFVDIIVESGDVLAMRVKFWDNTVNIGNNWQLPKEKRGIARRYRKSMQKLINAIDWDDPMHRPKNTKSTVKMKKK